MKIGKDTVVAIDYVLKDDAGEILDESAANTPLTYLHGVGGIIAGLETALEGKAVGDSMEISIPPNDAYGLRDERMVQDVPRAAFGNSKVEPGMNFQADGKNAGSRMVTVLSVSDDKVRIDANHPLADKTLHFDVKVVSVRQATAEELSHRHVHGSGGHQH